MRRLLVTFVWLLAAFALVFTIAIVWSFVRGPHEWRHNSGIRSYAWGFSSDVFYLVIIDRPPDSGQVPGETGVISFHRSGFDRRFILGRWVRDLRDVYYSPIPNDTFDPQKLPQYRRYTEHDRRFLVLNGMRSAALFGLVRGFVFIAWARRAIIRRRLSLLNHCRACGYDLRATPDRCPECGAITPG